MKNGLETPAKLEILVPETVGRYGLGAGKPETKRHKTLQSFQNNFARLKVVQSNEERDSLLRILRNRGERIKQLSGKDAEISERSLRRRVHLLRRSTRNKIGLRPDIITKFLEIQESRRSKNGFPKLYAAEEPSKNGHKEENGSKKNGFPRLHTASANLAGGLNGHAPGSLLPLEILWSPDVKDLESQDQDPFDRALAIWEDEQG